MINKFLAIFVLVILAPYILKFLGVGVIVCTLVFVLAIVCYWWLRHRLPRNYSDASQSARTRMARKAINVGMMDSEKAMQTFKVTKKDMRNQKYHDELFW